MKKVYESIALVLCAVLLVVGSVMATMAYLQSKTGTVTNTFSVGNVSITMDEAQVDEYGKPIAGAARIPNAESTKTGNAYKLIPGHNYMKDPTIHVAGDSEDCWLFIELKNDIAEIESGTTIADQLTANGWKQLGPEGIYYHDIATGGSNIKTFEDFTIKSDANIANYADKTIEITAFAVQEDGFVDNNSNGTAADEAWNATYGATQNP